MEDMYMGWEVWWLVIIFGGFIIVSLLQWIFKVSGLSYKLYIKNLDQNDIEFYLSLNTDIMNEDINNWCKYHNKQIINGTITDL